MIEGIVACPVHGDNETTSRCPDCRPYMYKNGNIKIGELVQLGTKAKKSEDFYKYYCTCGGKTKYIGSEWHWECEKCGAKNY